MYFFALVRGLDTVFLGSTWSNMFSILHTNRKHDGKMGIILAVRERSSSDYEGAPPLLLDVLIDGEIRRNASCRWFEVVGEQE